MSFIEALMKCFLLVVGAIGLTAIASNAVMAKGGGMLHLFKSQMEVGASTSTVSHAGVPTFSASPAGSLAGCGHGRYRDSATHRCRGPADIGY
jgi:hypothetical protein